MSSLKSLAEPFFRALGSVLRRMLDLRLWIPFIAIGVVKILLLGLMARIDLLPSSWLAALLEVFPAVEDSIRYPELVLHLPQVSRYLDLLLFLSLGAVVEGWAITRLVEGWTGTAIKLWPNARRGIMRITSLLVFAALIALLPLIVHRALMTVFSPMIALWGALGLGITCQVLLFCAPVFRIVDDVSMFESIRRSARLFAVLPMALPLCILLLAALHAPALFLRFPVFSFGVERDPEWIWLVLVAQIPFDVIGAFLAVAIATRFRMSSLVRLHLLGASPGGGSGAHRQPRLA